MFNTYLSKSRVVIENVFGLLKGRWRCLIYVNTYSIKKCIKIITACCVLHNFCYLIGDFCNDIYVETYDGHNEDAIHMANQTGNAKRERLCELIC